MNSKSDSDRVSRIDLGDSVGDDERLHHALDEIARQANADASERAAERKVDLLALIQGPLRMIAAASVSSFRYIKERVTDHVIRLATAEKIESEAKLIRAEAEVTRKVGKAEAEIKTAQAEAIRSQAQIELIDKLTELGIDWRAEQDKNGHVNIVVTRRIEED